MKTHRDKSLKQVLRALGLGLASAALFGVHQASANELAAENPVVVELFTSQGCYSCPPAEAYLRELAEEDDIIALEFHVDYWDYIGWKDPFATPEYTQRQRDYVHRMGGRYVYTPQMVIGGRADEVGSRRAAVAARIDAVAMEQRVEGPSPKIDIAHNGDRLAISIDGPKSGNRAYDIVVVSFDRSHETDVPRGENAGKSLVNTHTVRSLQKIGTWNGGKIEATIAADQIKGKGGCAILVQERGAGPILAARMMRFH